MTHRSWPSRVFVTAVLGPLILAAMLNWEHDATAATPTTRSASAGTEANCCSVTGLLVRADGSAAANVPVYVYPYKDQKLVWWGLTFHDDNKRAGPADNPRALTNSRGRFRIQFTRAFFKKAASNDFAIGTFGPHGPQILKAKDPVEASIILNGQLFDVRGALDINGLFKTKGIVVPD